MSLRTNSFLPLLAAALLLLVSPSSSGAERVNRFKSFTRLVLLPHSGAKCLDGSPPAYYFRPGTGAGRRKWHVHLPTGGWCFSPGECIARANSSLGSSRFWARRLPAAVENGERVINPAEAYPELGGLLSQDSITNPAFHSWNLVWLVYCDGGAYSSMRGRADLGNGATVYMQGRQILEDIIYDLRTNRGMGAASHVLFSGSSAGAHAVLLNCDRLAASFPRASTKCLADSGFFVGKRPLAIPAALLHSSSTLETGTQAPSAWLTRASSWVRPINLSYRDGREKTHGESLAAAFQVATT
ncbi:hypothetical protein CLOM_g12668 [Closterium sp. NIES-68]|nr:hypothetical protein CLOM_g12668 [Closterium sp. NIES-68]